MSPVEPVDPRVRLAIARWPDDAPRGAVTTFCLEQKISRKTFYAIRKRALIEGQAAALEPRSRRPHHSPTQLSDEVKRQALEVRAALEASGLDHGPISVHERMRTMGLAAPSEASLARIFREAGVARAEPKKRPRAAWRRFVYPAPNACWQLDATEYVLTGGRKCVIFQLEDDHSRLAVASHVADGETADAALRVMRKGIAARGVPQRLLTDNGLALNPSRRGWDGQLVIFVTSLGVAAITGKPYKPTTQGKNERFHQTLFRYLDKQPIAATIAELQAQVDAFDTIYNTQRPHQSLPGRITPQQAWDATPVAEAPRPQRQPIDPVLIGGEIPTPHPEPDESDEAVLTVGRDGAASIRGVRFQVGRDWIGTEVRTLWNRKTITFFDLQGTMLIEQPWPPKGTRYVSNGRPRGRRPQHPKNVEVSPMI
jgi:transposase InsO family protein